jgi:cytoskeletal protein RodZ
METPGEYLSRERELRGVTVLDMAEAMKLSAKLITALEHDDQESLPHPTYVKGFVRTYAIYLGIDEDDAVLRYEAYQSDRRIDAERVQKFTEDTSLDLSSRGSIDTHEVESTLPTNKDGSAFASLFGRGRRGNNRTIVGFVAAGILIVVLYFVFAGGIGEAPQPTDAQVVRAEKTTPAAQAKKIEKAIVSAPKVAKNVKQKGSKDTSAKVVKATKPALKTNKDAPKKSAVIPVVTGAPLVKESAVAVEKELLLEVIASDTTWLAVEIDGEHQREALLQPGETVRWRGAKVFF